MAKYVGDAIDLSNWQPPQRTRMVNGEVVIEKLPQMMSMLVLDAAGNSRHLPMANGMGRPNPSDPGWLQRKPQKEAAGMIPYGACPKARGFHSHLPENMQDGAPCKLGADGHPISNAHPCACIVKLQEIRRAKHGKAMAELEQRFKPRDSRDAEQRDAIFQKFMEEGAKRK